MEQPKYTQKNKKIDVLQFGKICDKMALGKYGIEYENEEKIIDEIKEGKYNAPIVLSKEIISFIKDMARMDTKIRLNIYDLCNHEFLFKYFKLSGGQNNFK